MSDAGSLEEGRTAPDDLGLQEDGLNAETGSVDGELPRWVASPSDRAPSQDVAGTRSGGGGAVATDDWGQWDPALPVEEESSVEAREQFVEEMLAQMSERDSRDFLAEWVYSSVLAIQRLLPPGQDTIGSWASKVGSLPNVEVVRFVADPEARAAAVLAAAAELCRTGQGDWPAAGSAAGITAVVAAPAPRRNWDGGQQTAVAPKRRRRRHRSRGRPSGGVVAADNYPAATAPPSPVEDVAEPAAPAVKARGGTPRPHRPNGRTWRSGRIASSPAKVGPGDRSDPQRASPEPALISAAVGPPQPPPQSQDLTSFAQGNWRLGMRRRRSIPPTVARLVGAAPWAGISRARDQVGLLPRPWCPCRRQSVWTGCLTRRCKRNHLVIWRDHRIWVRLTRRLSRTTSTPPLRRGLRGRCWSIPRMLGAALRMGYVHHGKSSPWAPGTCGRYGRVGEGGPLSTGRVSRLSRRLVTGRRTASPIRILATSEVAALGSAMHHSVCSLRWGPATCLCRCR